VDVRPSAPSVSRGLEMGQHSQVCDMLAQMQAYNPPTAAKRVPGVFPRFRRFASRGLSPLDGGLPGAPAPKKGMGKGAVLGHISHVGGKAGSAGVGAKGRPC
jgi:hypothetical protein